MAENDPLSSALMTWTEIFMHRSMHHFVRYSKELGISIPQIGALVLIRQKGAYGVSQLGSEIGISSAGASQMLDRLVSLGLIMRTEDPDDRRNKQLALTEKGRSVLQESMHARQQWIQSLSNSMTVSEKETLLSSVNLLIEKSLQLQQNEQTPKQES